MTAFYNQGPYGIAHYSAGEGVDIAGTLSIVVTTAPAILNGDFTLAGDLPIVVTPLPAITIIGPLWEPDTPCPAPPWGASTPCPDSVWGQSPQCPDPGWTPSEACDG
jgi:hypothetical protein